MKESILYMLGFISKDRAIESGYTHNGLYYFIPIWLKKKTNPLKDVSIEYVEKHFILVIATMVIVYIESLFIIESNGIVIKEKLKTRRK